MQDNADKPSGDPNVIALPPLILAAALVLGLILNFAWPAKFLAREFSAEFSAPVGVFLNETSEKSIGATRLTCGGGYRT
jgi:hypothetical protein